MRINIQILNVTQCTYRTPNAYYFSVTSTSLTSQYNFTPYLSTTLADFLLKIFTMADLETQTDPTLCVSFLYLMFCQHHHGESFPHTFVKWDSYLSPNTKVTDVIDEGLKKVNTETLRLLEINGIPTVWSKSMTPFAKIKQHGEDIIMEIGALSHLLLSDLTDKVIFFLPSSGYWTSLVPDWPAAAQCSSFIVGVEDEFFHHAVPSLVTRDILCVAKRGSRIFRSIPWSAGLFLYYGYSRTLQRRVFFDNVLYDYYTVPEEVVFEKTFVYDFPEAISDIVYDGSSDEESEDALSNDASISGAGSQPGHDAEEIDDIPSLESSTTSPTTAAGDSEATDSLEFDL